MSKTKSQEKLPLNADWLLDVLRIETTWERKGRIEGKIEVAQRMLAQKVSVEDIMKFTDLSREEIEKL